jgi:hypothetical protein
VKPLGAPPRQEKARHAPPKDSPDHAPQDRKSEKSDNKRPWSKTPKKLKGKMFKPKPARAMDKKQEKSHPAAAHSPLKRKQKP